MEIKDYIDVVSGLITELPVAKIQSIAKMFLKAKTIYIFGNGGSSSTAEHIVCDLQKANKVRAVALTSVPLITAWANDQSYSSVFAEQVTALVTKNDLVVGISASGESVNVALGLTKAKEKGCKTIGLTGCDGGAVSRVSDVCMIVPSYDIQMIEDCHLMIGHIISRYLLEMEF